jgi:general stress protein YciG
MTDAPKPKARRGFAAMSPERRREIARKGGAAVAPENRSFAKSKDLAASAGRKGGEASRGGGRTKRKPVASEA